MDFLTLACVVAVYATVQSIFGVGLLVFGTPTLLLLGFSFEHVLAYLLPCSIVVSVFQVIDGGLRLDSFRRKFLLYGAPGALLGTLAILLLIERVNIRPVVGGMLLATAAIRVIGPLREAIGRLVARRQDPLIGALGLLHGLTNLGGGFLVVMVGALYKDKREIRSQIAFAYAILGSIQFATLVLTVEPKWGWPIVVTLPVVAALVFFMLGQRAFRATSQNAYRDALTALIFAFGIVLLVL